MDITYPNLVIARSVKHPSMLTIVSLPTLQSPGTLNSVMFRLSLEQGMSSKILDMFSNSPATLLSMSLRLVISRFPVVSREIIDTENLSLRLDT